MASLAGRLWETSEVGEAATGDRELERGELSHTLAPACPHRGTVSWIGMGWDSDSSPTTQAPLRPGLRADPLPNPAWSRGLAESGSLGNSDQHKLFPSPGTRVTAQARERPLIKGQSRTAESSLLEAGDGVGVRDGLAGAWAPGPPTLTPPHTYQPMGLSGDPHA